MNNLVFENYYHITLNSPYTDCIDLKGIPDQSLWFLPIKYQTDLAQILHQGVMFFTIMVKLYQYIHNSFLVQQMYVYVNILTLK